jgi:hypothetical protein
LSTQDMKWRMEWAWFGGFDMEVDDITSDFAHDVFLFLDLDLLFFTSCRGLSSRRESL